MNHPHSALHLDRLARGPPCPHRSWRPDGELRGPPTPALTPACGPCSGAEESHNLHFPAWDPSALRSELGGWHKQRQVSLPSGASWSEFHP